MSLLLPVHTVEVGWETAVTGTFRFDISKFDGTDVFANAFTNFFTGSLDNVTGDVDGKVGATISRGRDALLGPIQAGTFDFTLSNVTDPSYYNPGNPASPLAAKDPGFVPLRPVRVRATVGGVTYPRFYGFIRTAKYNPATRSVRIHAEDILLWLSRVKPTVAPMAATTTQAVIGALLDAANWNDPNMRKLAAYGDAIAAYGDADGSRFALPLIVALLEAERGLFFADSAGRATYEDRNARSRRITPLATFTSSELSLVGDGTSGISLDEINNEITVTGADTIPESASNVNSQRDFGVGEVGDVSSDFIANAAAAFDIANWEVALATTLRSPYVFGVDPFALDRVYQLDLQDRLLISGGGDAGDYHVERIVETFGFASGRFGVELTLSKRGVSGLVFDGPVFFDGPGVFVA